MKGPVGPGCKCRISDPRITCFWASEATGPFTIRSFKIRCTTSLKLHKNSSIHGLQGSKIVKGLVGKPQCWHVPTYTLVHYNCRTSPRSNTNVVTTQYAKQTLWWISVGQGAQIYDVDFSFNFQGYFCPIMTSTLTKRIELTDYTYTAKWKLEKKENIQFLLSSGHSSTRHI